MSRSNPTIKNPATRFMQWRGGADKVKDAKTGKENYEGGRVTYYDKEAEQDVEVPLPFSFLVLDELSTITGFDESTNSGFWSNDVRDLSKQEFIVKKKSGVVARGKYADISDKIKGMGAKYTQAVYLAFKDDQGELVIGHFKFAGASLSAWIEFKKKWDVMQCAVFITDEPKLEKKGANHYFSPVFEGQKVSEATEAAVKELDKELQAYLNTYFATKPYDQDDDNEEVDDEPEEDGDTDVETEEKPDVKVGPKEEPATEPAKAAPKEEKKGELNLADIPF